MESVADHSYGVSILALLVPLPDNINREKLIKMALIHDAAEALTGDLVTESEKTNDATIQEKHVQEQEAIKNSSPTNY